MCGILAAFASTPVNQLLYDGLLVLQHRGQDAAGIVTVDGHTFHMRKDRGLVHDVFRSRDMQNLIGNVGIGHCRYPTAGSSKTSAEAQPLYVNSPFGIALAHNGNLVNADVLRKALFQEDFRHINTKSDSEILLNVLAKEIQNQVTTHHLTPDQVFNAVSALHKRVSGAYAVVALIAGQGLLAFRDPNGIRPLALGHNKTGRGMEYLIASESVAIESLGFTFTRDVAPGEAIFIDMAGHCHSKICAESPKLSPCIFEYVYMARPDSTIDGVSVYQSRLNMGKLLAEKILRDYSHLDIDVVIPIPESSRPSALELANRLKLPFREGFIKNRYIGRTFIMPGQAVRQKSVRQKLNAVSREFQGLNVLLVDDSIVRGTTAREIVQMARDAGAKKVFFASAAPPVEHINVYGIDMPTRSELISYNRSVEEVAKMLGADELIFQDLSDLIESVRKENPKIDRFETSCFDGCYITDDVNEDYINHLENARYATSASAAQMDLNLTNE